MQLDLSANQVGHQGAQYLIQALQNNSVRPNQIIYLDHISHF